MVLGESQDAPLFLVLSVLAQNGSTVAHVAAIQLVLPEVDTYYGRARKGQIDLGLLYQLLVRRLICFC